MTPVEKRVLVAMPTGRDAPAVVEVLRKNEIQACVIDSLAALAEEIGAGVGVVLIAEEALFGRDTGPLLAKVTAQPPWSDLPFIVFSTEHVNPKITNWRKTLISELGNVTFSERPIHQISMLTAVRSALRSRSRQYELRTLFEERDNAASSMEQVVAFRTQQLAQANARLKTEIAEREAAETRLHQSQKLEAIGQLARGIAHDFNNLLMVINGALELLARGQPAERQAKLLSGMKNATRRGSNLTRQLLVFSRQQPFTPETIDVQLKLESIVQLLGQSLGENVEVAAECAGDLWTIKVDSGELELVILNLAVNARDAMPRGGKVTIKASNVVGDATTPGDFVRISVIDDGTGMAPDIIARATEPFFTTKEVGKGSGLGLAQAYGFAEHCGGSLEIESEIGAGTTISLLLPRSDCVADDAVLDDVTATPPQEAAPGARTVLIVEDDDEVAELVQGMFVELGFQTLRESSADLALATIERGVEVNLVFSDILMPGVLSGVDLANELHQQRPGLPIVLTSGHVSESATSPNGDKFKVLTKPYGLAELTAHIKLALGG